MDKLIYGRSHEGRASGVRGVVRPCGQEGSFVRASSDWYVVDNSIILKLPIHELIIDSFGSDTNCCYTILRQLFRIGQKLATLLAVHRAHYYGCV